MGSDISDWAEAAGAIYMGANSSWEIIWTVVAAGCLVLALVVGSKHELDAYNKAEEDK